MLYGEPPRVIVTAMSLRRLLALAAPPLAIALPVACGSRTPLLLPTLDSAREAGVDAGFDAFVDDVVEEPDAIELDALPPIDVTPPPVDAPNPCPDAGDTLIYVITENNVLYSFNPPTLAFTRIGVIACPAPSGYSPFSMAVDQSGIAYVEFTDPSRSVGELFRVSTATASCEATGFQMGQEGFPPNFGMGFSRDPNGMTETLYVAGDPAPQGTVPSVLGSIDVKTFTLTTTGTFVPFIYSPELTGTGAGDLFAFYQIDPNLMNSPTAIGQIDKANGSVIAETLLPGVVTGQGWAFGFWGGDFYIFTAPSGTSTVTRYSTSNGSIDQVASLGDIIVGAGVSTCAPAR
jgi:hypothetical protein